MRDWRKLAFASGVIVGVVAGCAGGVGSWGADDRRKATEVVRAMEGQLALCASDGGCRADDVRALGDLARCKAASMLYAHRAPVPEDGGGGCQ